MAIRINGKTTEELDVASLVIELRNQDVSSARITLRGAKPESSDLAAGEEVEIQVDDFVFKGTVEQRPFSDKGNGRDFTVTVLDGWNKLATQTIYGTPGLEDDKIARDTRVVVGGRIVIEQPAEGPAYYRYVPIPITTWLQRVATQFAGFTLEGDPPEGIIPPSEADGITVAEAIKSILKWFPGSVATVAGQDAKITIRHPAAMPTFDLPYSGHNSEVRIIPRHDLALAGVTIFFRKKVQSSLASKEIVVADSAGTIGPGAWIASIDLLPETHQITAADLELDDIEPDDIEWWKKLLPALFKEPIMEGATVQEVELYKEFPEIDHIILKGSLPNNFKDGCSGPFSENSKIFECSNGTIPVVGKVRGQVVFAHPGGAQSSIKVEFLGTNLNDTNKKITRFARENKEVREPGESLSDFIGLAASIYSAGRTLEYEGSVTWKVKKVPTLEQLPLGCRIRFTDAPVDAWQTLDAPVYAVRIDAFKRTITAEFGPDTYLGPSDRAALKRAHDGWKRPKKERLGEDGGEPAPESAPPSNPTIPPTISQPGSTVKPKLRAFELVGYDNNHVRWVRSTCNGTPPPGFNLDDEGDPYLIASTNGLAWIKITIDADTGALSFTPQSGSTMPADDATNHYELFGSWTSEVINGKRIYTTHNDRYGPLYAQTCRRRDLAGKYWQLTVFPDSISSEE